MIRVKDLKYVSLVFILVLIFAATTAKTAAQDKVNLKFSNISLTEALEQVTKAYHVNIAYNPALTNSINVNVRLNSKKLEEVLKILIKESGLRLIRIDEQSFILEQIPPPVKVSTPVVKKKHTISGYVAQSGSGEKLIAATVALHNEAKGTITNEYGFYSLTLDEGEYDITYTFVGFHPVTLHLILDKDIHQNVNLTQGQQLDVVVIRKSEDNNLQNLPQMSSNSFSMGYLRNLPIMLGEADVMKTFLLVPGVTAGNEGDSRMYVRGGSPDQNLILLDGVPVYHATHLLGYFSIFNASAITSNQLYTASFPARYGERIASVLDIRTKEGNMEKFEGEASLSLLSSKISYGGPIIKNKTSFFVAVRRTYIDLISKLFGLNYKVSGNEIGTDYFFYDINAKVNHKFSDNDRIFFSFYKGEDSFKYLYDYAFNVSDESQLDKTSLALKWGNTIGAARWNHVFSSKLFSNITAAVSRYKFDINNNYDLMVSPDSTNSYRSEFYSEITDLRLLADFNYSPAVNHNVRFGATAVLHNFKPQVNQEQLGIGTQKTTLNSIEQVKAKEFAAYLEDKIIISKKISANIGFRSSAFNVQGKTYFAFEPRLSFGWKTTENSSLKLSYSRMSQYLHLLSTNYIALPSDLWIPSTKDISPQHSDIFALGYSYFWKDYSLSAETYYKEINGLLSYQDGQSYNTNLPFWNQKTTTGSGICYGTEVTLKKTNGKLKGWIGYTLSWSKRKFEDINYGKSFPYTFDRRHGISTTWSYPIRANIDANISWIFYSGRAYTLNNEKYPAYVGDINQGSNGTTIYTYSSRNNVRLPAYHRLDIGVNFTKKKKWGERIWSVGVYNVYNRNSSFYLYQNYSQGELKSVELFSLIPSISYTYKF